MNIETLKAVLEAAKIGSTRFVHIRNYKNQDGEVSNYLINLGMSYEEQRQKDIVKLLSVNYLDKISEAARCEMLASKMDNSTKEYRSRGSKAQIDAYMTFANNVKLHKEKLELYLKAFLVRKEVIVNGPRKLSRSALKTIAKRKIAKELDLTTEKYRLFRFRNMSHTTISINGDQIEITYR